MEYKDMLDKIDAEMKKVEQVIADGMASTKGELEGTAKTLGQVKDAAAKAEEKYLKLEDEKKAIEEKMAADKKEADDRMTALEVKFAKPGYGQPEAKMATPGQQFILSDQYQDARKVNRKSTEAFAVGSLFERKQITDATRGDLPPDRAPVWSERLPEYIFEPGQRQIRLFDLMNVAPTTSNAIEYFREILFNADGGRSQGGETAGKHQNRMNFEKETSPVETIADWIPASRQVLDDAPQLQSHIDSRLTYSVMNEAERQVLFGAGVGGELLGIMNTPGVVTVGPPAGTDTNIDQVRRAIATVRQSEYMATAVVLNSNDWAQIELTKGSDLHYIWVQVPNGGEMRLWRVPVIETTIMEEGQFLTGAFGLGAQLWDRQTATIRVSESHADYFVRNAIAILAELRMAITTYRPSAFVSGRFDSFVSP